MLILVLLVDPVTGETENAISLHSFTSLASLDIGIMKVGQRTHLDLLCAVLSTWRSTPVSRIINLSVYFDRINISRDEFLAFMDQIGQLMEEHCSGSFLQHIAFSLHNEVDATACRSNSHNYQDQYRTSSAMYRRREDAATNRCCLD